MTPIMSSTTIGHLRNHSRGDLQRSVVVNSGRKPPAFCTGISRKEGLKVRTNQTHPPKIGRDRFDTEVLERAFSAASKSPIRSRMYTRRVPRSARCEPCFQTTNDQCSTLAQTAYPSRRNWLKIHRNYQYFQVSYVPIIPLLGTRRALVYDALSPATRCEPAPRIILTPL